MSYTKKILVLVSECDKLSKRELARTVVQFSLPPVEVKCLHWDVDFYNRKLLQSKSIVSQFQMVPNPLSPRPWEKGCLEAVKRRTRESQIVDPSCVLLDPVFQAAVFRFLPGDLFVYILRDLSVHALLACVCVSPSVFHSVSLCMCVYIFICSPSSSFYPKFSG